MKYWIGKVTEDTFGHKIKPSYILRSFSADKKRTEAFTRFLAGFAGYEVVQIKLTEVKKKGKK